MREIATGIGILASEDPTPWIWGRVAGDVLDIATLAPGLSADNPRRDTVAVAMGLVGAVTAVDIACARSLGQRPPQVYDYSDRAGLSATVLMRRPAPAP
ncbi:hypothetical protein FHS85_001545 [Rhodoligotrophos appendicifer]|uniref:hypothetical protein n=1 Tax=Rhodoligotrophos appendicifer TaxID=987056 RepID=UPI001185CD95|nr:hypothetical protein [Rhodoligotrophos appendicifer]